jgi:GT2 family glycosyltransferase
MYMEDADLGRRIRQIGYKILLSSEARIIHFLRQSSSQHSDQMLKEIKRGQLYYYYKHNNRLAFHVLKVYLVFRFQFKRIVFCLKKDMQACKVYEEVLKVIREFDGEDYT